MDLQLLKLKAKMFLSQTMILIGLPIAFLGLGVCIALSLVFGKEELQKQLTESSLNYCDELEDIFGAK